MRHFDFSPLYRASVGFDRMQKLMDSASRLDEASVSYPPYNIEKRDEDSYRISMAVAGFAESDIEIIVKEGSLFVSGQRKAEDETEKGRYLHRGIAARTFERRFELAEHIRVAGADLENGILSIDLLREVPEAMKPRTIAINGGQKSLTDKAA